MAAYARMTTVTFTPSETSASRIVLGIGEIRSPGYYTDAADESTTDGVTTYIVTLADDKLANGIRLRMPYKTSRQRKMNGPDIFVSLSATDRFDFEAYTDSEYLYPLHPLDIGYFMYQHTYADEFDLRALLKLIWLTLRKVHETSLRAKLFNVLGEDLGDYTHKLCYPPAAPEAPP